MENHATVCVHEDGFRVLGCELRTADELRRLLRDRHITSLEILIEAGAPYELIGRAIYTAHRCVPPDAIRVSGAGRAG